MAESIYTTLQARDSFKVNHEGTTREFTLPKWVPSDEEVEVEEKLIEKLEEAGLLHAVLQSGIKQEVINLRAVARPGKGEPWDDDAQARVSNYEPTTCKRPKSGGGKKAPSKEEALKVLTSAGMTQEEILALIAGQG